MIFVTLGSQKFQFNRLLKILDGLIENHVINQEVFAQIGYSDYRPQHYAYTKFLNRNDFLQKIRQSDYVITHGGAGAIISAVKARKKIIVVPRLAKFGEHVDDHQMQLVEQFDNMGIITSCYDCSTLQIAFEKARDKVLMPYESNTSGIIQSIEAFLKAIG